MGERIIIYGKTKDRANLKLQNILDNMLYSDVLQVKKSLNDFAVTTKNGDIYKTVTASDSSRGIKWHRAYIDKDIDEYILNNIILPSSIPIIIDEDNRIEISAKNRINWF